MPPMLTLYHSPRCPFSRRTRLVLELAGVPYDAVEVEPGAVPEPYLLISPRGIVPAVVHGEESLCGSTVVNEYVDACFKGGLMPSDPVGQAKVRMLVREADMEFLPVLNGLEWAVRSGGDPALLEQLRGQATDLVAHMETLFGESGPFLLGEDLTMADVAFSSTVPHLVDVALGVDVAPRLEAVHAWIERFRAMPEWGKVSSGLWEPPQVTVGRS